MDALGQVLKSRLLVMRPPSFGRAADDSSRRKRTAHRSPVASSQNRETSATTVDSAPKEAARLDHGAAIKPGHFVLRREGRAKGGVIESLPQWHPRDAPAGPGDGAAHHSVLPSIVVTSERARSGPSHSAPVRVRRLRSRGQ